MNVQTVASATQELAASIREISSQVQGSVTVSSRATDETQRTSQLIHGLSSVAEKIGTIIQLIQAIVSQTAAIQNVTGETVAAITQFGSTVKEMADIHRDRRGRRGAGRHDRRHRAQCRGSGQRHGGGDAGDRRRARGGGRNGRRRRSSPRGCGGPSAAGGFAEEQRRRLPAHHPLGGLRANRLFGVRSAGAWELRSTANLTAVGTSGGRCGP